MLASYFDANSQIEYVNSTEILGWNQQVKWFK